MADRHKQPLLDALDYLLDTTISADEARTLVLDAGGSSESAQAVSEAYSDSQIAALQQSLFVVFGLLVLALLAPLLDIETAAWVAAKCAPLG